jgi:CheY-like chemotaxis protein
LPESLFRRRRPAAQLVHLRQLRGRDHAPGDERVQGTTHEIGVQFDSTINPRDFLSLDAFSDGFTLEHVDPEQLDGCVLAVDDSEMDLRILQHYLKGTMIKFRTAETIEDGLTKAAEGCDLILCDYMIGEERGAEFVSRLRESGSRTPVIMVTADQTSTTREQLLESKADAFLAKPVGREVLLRAIAEFMLMGSLGDAVKSSLPEGHPNLALLPDFTKDLAEIASGLEKSLESDDFKTCRRLCLRISGTGPSLGFEPLAQCAERVANAVAASKSTVSASAEITSLVGLLRKVAA